ncbi:hypothetical protein DID88_001028 [Monilinia fructigena]|uniref:Major facilitator superfamily (MFS) profile domain-containing protein n=1 Tax=Monilinia fructigena TaxID=38457 RepID=A0A395IYZ0_9HELO|nr:hypothetical protein DID88_001028 [Monilinia fructigena]
MTQLIIFREFQGIGSAAIYSLAVVMCFELVPSEKFAKYTSIVSAVPAIGLVLGPMLGGIITNYTTWRWGFLYNVILGALIIFALFLTIPKKISSPRPSAIYP